MTAENLEYATTKLIRQNVALVKRTYPSITRRHIQSLRELTRKFGFSAPGGEIILLDHGWFVTHAGLLRLAEQRGCLGIDCRLEEKFSDLASGRWVFKATVLKSENERFVGYGDADPTNVSALVRGAEMRIAETRAVNRALRKAYGIGICSVEEMGTVSMPTVPSPAPKIPPAASSADSRRNGNGNGNGHKVRDRLCQIIRQHKLDPELVKAYAVDFCGTAALKDASREQVEEFVQHLAESAQRDRSALLCQLNSYARGGEEVVA